MQNLMNLKLRKSFNCCYYKHEKTSCILTHTHTQANTHLNFFTWYRCSKTDDVVDLEVGLPNSSSSIVVVIFYLKL